MMMPPNAQRSPFALVTALNQGGWLSDPEASGSRTSSVTTYALSMALRYLERSRKRGAPQDERADLDKADLWLEHALHRVGGSQRYRLIMWRQQLSEDKWVLTFGDALDGMLAQWIPYPLIIKQYLLSDGAPDTGKILKIGTLEERLTLARERDRSIPAVSISAYTTRFLIALRTGENLAYEVLPKTAPEDHAAIARDLLETLDPLCAASARWSDVMAGAEPENLEKVTGCVEAIARGIGQPEATRRSRVQGDLARLYDALRCEGLSVPHYDTKTPNIVREADGTLRLIDLDNAVALRTTRGVLRAHVAFDPLLSIPLDSRIELAGSLDSAVYYTTYRCGRAFERGRLAPIADWIPIAQRRAHGHFEGWQEILTQSEARERYPALADLAMACAGARPTFTARTPKWGDTPFTNAARASDR